MPSERVRLFWRTLAYHALGREQEARALLGEYIEKHGDGRSHGVARIYAFRGEADQAFDWLERAYTLRAPLRFAKVEPLLANLHDDPRWVPFLEKMGLAD